MTMALPQRQTSTPPLSLDPQLLLEAEAEQPTTEVSEPLQVCDHEAASSTIPVVGMHTAAADRLQQKENNLQLIWPTLTVGFCTGAATQIAVEACKTDAVSFHLLCMLLGLAFSAIFVAMNIASKHANIARALEHVGVFVGNAAYFLAITIALPSSLKVVSWAIYALALLVVCICNYR